MNILLLNKILLLEIIGVVWFDLGQPNIFERPNMRNFKILTVVCLLALMMFPACASMSGAGEGQRWEWGDSQGARMQSISVDGGRARGTLDLGRADHDYRNFVVVETLDAAGEVTTTQRGRLKLDRSGHIPRRHHIGRFDVKIPADATGRVRISVEN